MPCITLTLGYWPFTSLTKTNLGATIIRIATLTSLAHLRCGTSSLIIVSACCRVDPGNRSVLLSYGLLLHQSALLHTRDPTSSLLATPHRHCSCPFDAQVERPGSTLL